jgi:hypothetical protein
MGTEGTEDKRLYQWCTDAAGGEIEASSAEDAICRLINMGEWSLLDSQQEADDLADGAWLLVNSQDAHDSAQRGTIPGQEGPSVYYLIRTRDLSQREYYPCEHTEFEIRTSPGTTNMSNEPRTRGWLGTSSNQDAWALGAYPSLQEAMAAAAADAALPPPMRLVPAGEREWWCCDHEDAVMILIADREHTLEAGDWLAAHAVDLQLVPAGGIDGWVAAQRAKAARDGYYVWGLEEYAQDILDNEAADEAEETGLVFRSYTYSNSPNLLPLEEAEWSEEVVVAAGFDPDDEEISVCRLTADWKGHPAGSLVVTGLTVSGHPFAVASASA